MKKLKNQILRSLLPAAMAFSLCQPLRPYAQSAGLPGGLEQKADRAGVLQASAQSQGDALPEDAAAVYMTSTEQSGSRDWYLAPIPMQYQMTRQEDLPITAADAQAVTEIHIDVDKQYQTMLGVGTSLEESTIHNLLKLSPDVQEEFLRKLIDPEQGGMTLFRLTIGTSDFTAQPFYSYYDGRTLDASNAIFDEGTGTWLPDWQNTTGNGFSIQKDREYGILSTVQKVLELAKEYGVSDQVKFFASPWSPPGWMKNETDSSRSYEENALLLKGGSLKEEAIGDLAMYLTRYLEEYAKEGIPIYAVTLQNEPLLEINYPSCAMTARQEGLLAKALKKAVSESSILSEEAKSVKIWAFDHNASEAVSFAGGLSLVEGALDAIDGMAFHDYSGNLEVMAAILNNRLNQDGRTGRTVHLTERSVWGTAGANSIITYFRNGASSYNAWVTMLDSNIGVHQWVGTPDPTMFARLADSQESYWAMPEFYITGQFARFIRPGFVRVDSTNTDYAKTVSNVVYLDVENKILTAVVVNGTGSNQAFKLLCQGEQIIGSLPAGTVGTYIWRFGGEFSKTSEDQPPNAPEAEPAGGGAGTDRMIAGIAALAAVTATAACLGIRRRRGREKKKNK